MFESTSLVHQSFDSKIHQKKTNYFSEIFSKLKISSRWDFHNSITQTKLSGWIKTFFLFAIRIFMYGIQPEGITYKLHVLKWKILIFWPIFLKNHKILQKFDDFLRRPFLLRVFALVNIYLENFSLEAWDGKYIICNLHICIEQILILLWTLFLFAFTLCLFFYQQN